MQTEHRVAANPQTKPTDMGCESADRLLSSADTIAIYYYYSARKLILMHVVTCFYTILQEPQIMYSSAAYLL